MTRLEFFKGTFVATLLALFGIKTNATDVIHEHGHSHPCRMPPRQWQLENPNWANKDHCDAGIWCYGRTEEECQLTRTRQEVGCLMEEEIRKLGGDLNAMMDRYQSIVQSHEEKPLALGAEKA